MYFLSAPCVLCVEGFLMFNTGDTEEYRGELYVV
jgi:hypothetical protein